MTQTTPSNILCKFDVWFTKSYRYMNVFSWFLPVEYIVIVAGDRGEQGTKGPMGIGVEGPVGVQGPPGNSLKYQNLKIGILICHIYVIFGVY